MRNKNQIKSYKRGYSILCSGLSETNQSNVGDEGDVGAGVGVQEADTFALRQVSQLVLC